MPEEPLIRIDPDRLHEERRNVDLGSEETAFAQLPADDETEATGNPSLDTTTSGSTLPAR